MRSNKSILFAFMDLSHFNLYKKVELIINSLRKASMTVSVGISSYLVDVSNVDVVLISIPYYVELVTMVCCPDERTETQPQVTVLLTDSYEHMQVEV